MTSSATSSTGTKRTRCIFRLKGRRASGTTSGLRQPSRWRRSKTPRWQHLPGGFHGERKRIKIHIQAVADTTQVMSSEELCWLAIAAVSAWLPNRAPAEAASPQSSAHSGHRSGAIREPRSRDRNLSLACRTPEPDPLLADGVLLASPDGGAAAAAWLARAPISPGLSARRVSPVVTRSSHVCSRLAAAVRGLPARPCSRLRRRCARARCRAGTAFLQKNMYPLSKQKNADRWRSS